MERSLTDEQKRIRDNVIPVAKKYGVDKVYLFGSRAKGNFTDDSDYDFCIEKGVVKSLFQMGGLISDLEDVFGEDKVDLVTTTMDESEFFDVIEKDMVELYARQ